MVGAGPRRQRRRRLWWPWRQLPSRGRTGGGSSGGGGAGRAGALLRAPSRTLSLSPHQPCAGSLRPFAWGSAKSSPARSRTSGTRELESVCAALGTYPGQACAGRWRAPGLNPSLCSGQVCKGREGGFRARSLASEWGRCTNASGAAPRRYSGPVYAGRWTESLAAALRTSVRGRGLGVDCPQQVSWGIGFSEEVNQVPGLPLSRGLHVLGGSGQWGKFYLKLWAVWGTNKRDILFQSGTDVPKQWKECGKYVRR